MDGCSDGEWNGQRYFACTPGRALFCPVTTLQLDNNRMSPSLLGFTQYLSACIAMHVAEWEDQDQAVQGDQFRKYIGDWKGIQGHLNSCYLDATIFGLFALSDVFDSLFLENANISLTRVHSPGPLTSAKEIQGEIGGMLWKGIVNPLRKLVFSHSRCMTVYDYLLSGMEL